MCHDNWILIFKILLADNNAKAGPQLCKYIPPQGASPWFCNFTPISQIIGRKKESIPFRRNSNKYLFDA